MTFTFVARCPETNALGVVTCTTGRSVGSVVPHAEPNVGAVATQHARAQKMDREHPFERKIGVYIHLYYFFSSIKVTSSDDIAMTFPHVW